MERGVESTHTVVARFEQQDDAREAMLDLEMKGIDADAIHVVTSPLPNNQEVLDSDVAVGGQFARQGAKGARREISSNWHLRPIWGSEITAANAANAAWRANRFPSGKTPLRRECIQRRRPN